MYCDWALRNPGVREKVYGEAAEYGIVCRRQNFYIIFLDKKIRLAGRGVQEEFMKKGEICEGIVEKVEFPNRGIVSVEERKVVVKNTLPGQRVRFRIQKIRKGACEGALQEVLEKAPKEIAPLCPHFALCGGCTYQNLSYKDQICLKTEQLKELLDGTVQRPYLFEGVKESPLPFAYRNKMEFSFGDEEKDGPVTLGMHKRGSFYDITPVPQCQIVDEDYRKILACLSEYVREQQLPFYHKLRHTGYLRHLLVRKGAKTGEILVVLVTSTQMDAPDEPWVKRLLELSLEGEIVGVLHTYNDSLADVVQSDRTEVLWGRGYFYEELLGLRFQISPFSFFQTNSLGAEVLYETAREYLGDTRDKIVFDLYSGTGTIAQMLAPVAERVVGVEIVEEAVEAARVNARLNGLSNCEFIAGDVLKVIDGLTDKPDLIVLDPPRDGIHPKALQKIVDFGVERIVYISCKPTSLARDLEILQGRGYRVVKCVGVDMFPGTGHVETVCLLSKLHANQHIEVELQMDELDLTAAESKATYEEIKDYVLKQSGLKVSNLYIAQVKEKCGIIERENYNLPKSNNSRQPKCPPEKEAAIREALEYFRMI